MKIVMIRIPDRKGGTQDVEEALCHFMVLKTMEGVIGVAYRLDENKYPIPIKEVNIFVPLIHIIQLFYQD